MTIGDFMHEHIVFTGFAIFWIGLAISHICSQNGRKYDNGYKDKEIIE